MPLFSLKPASGRAPATVQGVLDSTHGGLDEYRVHHERDVASLLLELRTEGAVVNISAANGAALTTHLVSCDAAQQRLGLAVKPDDSHLAGVIEADEAVAVAYLDSVKIQFDLANLLLVHGEQQSTLQAAWPRVIYRFQRRGAFRVRTLERSAPTARVRHPAIPDMTLALRVVDVSITGCALMLPEDTPGIQAGVRLHQVAVDLDADTRFAADIQMHHVTSVGQSGALRLGCEWLRLDGQAERALQRYIDQTQKRRRMMEK